MSFNEIGSIIGIAARQTRTPPHAYHQEAIGQEIRSHIIDEERDASRTFVRIVL